jgi:hypothetical protein
VEIVFHLILFEKHILVLKMSDFTLLDVDCGVRSDTKIRVLNFEAETARCCQLTLEWDEMFTRYLISLGKFELEE